MTRHLHPSQLGFGTASGCSNPRQAEAINCLVDMAASYLWRWSRLRFPQGLRSARLLLPQTPSAQLVRRHSMATALVFLRFCLGWCQIIFHARTMPPDRLFLRRKVPGRDHPGLHRRCKEAVASVWCSTIQRHSPKHTHTPQSHTHRHTHSHRHTRKRARNGQF